MQCNSCVAPTGSRVRGIALSTPTKAVSIRHAQHPTVRVLRQDSRRATGVACRASLDAETVTFATYLGLRLGAASCVGTFFGGWRPPCPFSKRGPPPPPRLTTTHDDCHARWSGSECEGTLMVIFSHLQPRVAKECSSHFCVTPSGKGSC